ncbi:whirlin, partial [Biomphalaria glabrata]
MASLKSRSTDYFPNRTMAPSIRQLQEALYTHLDDLEKNVFIEALSSYGRSRDVFELVNALKKVLNTPAKRELFPLVKRVIKHEDVDAFDLLTRDEKQHSTLPRPYLYRPHIADLTVLNKSRAMSAGNRTPSQAGTAKSEAQRSSTSTQHRSRARSKSVERGEKHKTLSRSSSKSNILGEIVEIDVGEPDGEDGGYGFTFRGGADIGVGIYVSSVDNGSNAQVRGLTVGDLIVEANNISFADVTHDEAARIIKAATRLHLTVSRVGRVPGKLTVLETFTWTDPKGRPVSPPLPGSGLAAGEDDGRRKSATLMLKGSDERKVNIVVQKGQGLGIMVRGGKEYGLGIFISGIDPFSVAENAGLKLGDQILDVNGRSFLDISHSEAVKQLKKRRHLMMTVRDVGKIPFSKTTIDETGWIESTKVESYEKSSSSRRSADGSVTDLDTQKKTTFLKGLGAMLSMSLPNSGHYKGQFHEQVRLLLNESEQASLSYYMAEYDKRAVSVQGLVQALFELLNTMAKFTLMSEIRLMIRSNDLAIFDELLAKRQIDQSLKEARKLLTNDVMSVGSYDSNDALKDDVHKRTLFSQQKPASGGLQTMESIHYSKKFQDSPHSFQLKSDSIRRLSTSTPNFTEVEKQIASKSRSRSRSPNSAHHIMQEMSPRITMRKQSREDNVRIVGKLDDPSDDSGVEINGQIFNGQTSVQHFQSSVYQPRRQ